MEPMTGTNNLFSRENVLFVMLIKRKEARLRYLLLISEPLMFFVVTVFFCFLYVHKLDTLTENGAVVKLEQNIFNKIWRMLPVALVNPSLDL